MSLSSRKWIYKTTKACAEKRLLCDVLIPGEEKALKRFLKFPNKLTGNQVALFYGFHSAEVTRYYLLNNTDTKKNPVAYPEELLFYHTEYVPHPIEKKVFGVFRRNYKTKGLTGYFRNFYRQKHLAERYLMIVDGQSLFENLMVEAKSYSHARKLHDAIVVE